MGEHEHKWGFGLGGYGDEYFRCEDGIDDDEGCQAVLTTEEVEAVLNEYAALKRENNELQAKVLHSEASDDTASAFWHGEDRIWDVLTSEQKQYWRDAIPTE